MAHKTRHYHSKSPPSNPAKVTDVGIRSQANGVMFCDVALGFLIAQAYHVSVTRVVAVAKPDYDKNVLDEDFDIAAKTDQPATKDEVWLMVQALLADRFKMAIHHENRLETVYYLTRTKDTGQASSCFDT